MRRIKVSLKLRTEAKINGILKNNIFFVTLGGIYVNYSKHYSMKYSSCSIKL